MGRANSILIWLSSVEIKIAAAVASHESTPLHQYVAKLHYTALHNLGLGVEVCKPSRSGAGKAARACKHKIHQKTAEYTALLYEVALSEPLLNSNNTQKAT